MNENKEQLILSLRFWHPKKLPEEIINNINLVPCVIQEVGKHFKLPNGKNRTVTKVSTGEILNDINKSTYIVYDILNTPNNDITDAIIYTNKILSDKTNFLKEFTETGGKIEYFIAIGSKKQYLFVLSNDIMIECTKLGVELGVEIYSDVEDSIME